MGTKVDVSIGVAGPIEINQLGDDVAGDIGAALVADLSADVEVAAAKVDDLRWVLKSGQKGAHGRDIGRHDARHVRA
jgi:hypothetical protein